MVDERGIQVSVIVGVVGIVLLGCCGILVHVLSRSFYGEEEGSVTVKVCDIEVAVELAQPAADAPKSEATNNKSEANNNKSEATTTTNNPLSEPEDTAVNIGTGAADEPTQTTNIVVRGGDLDAFDEAKFAQAATEAVGAEVKVLKVNKSMLSEKSMIVSVTVATEQGVSKLSDAKIGGYEISTSK